MSTAVLLAGALVVVGLVGIVLPVLPGSLLVGVGVGVWALAERSVLGWVVLAVCAALLVTGWTSSYVWTGRRLLAAGVPTRSLVAGALVGAVGFLVVPVVGLVLGFVVGLSLAELVRLGWGRPAVRSTLLALRAVVVAVGVELGFALAATAVWVGAVVVEARA